MTLSTCIYFIIGAAVAGYGAGKEYRAAWCLCALVAWPVYLFAEIVRMREDLDIADWYPAEASQKEAGEADVA